MKEGTLVAVFRDNGEVFISTIRNEAQDMGDRKVIWVEGIAGCYLLSRVCPIIHKNIHPSALGGFTDAVIAAKEA